MKEYAVRKALDAGVDPQVVLHIVQNESQWESDAVGDLHLTCPSTGRSVRARGLAQITECYHPEVSDSEAFDPEFSIDFLVEGVRQGKCRQEWSTCPI